MTKDGSRATGATPLLHTPEEAADLLRITVDKLRREVRVGNLIAVKIGRKVRFRPDHLHTYAAELPATTAVPSGARPRFREVVLGEIRKGTGGRRKNRRGSA